MIVVDPAIAADPAAAASSLPPGIPPPGFAPPISPAALVDDVETSALHFHQPYEEMIRSAIEALKDMNGSSRDAISKYIMENFSNLPPNHDTLLTHHLECLISKGVIGSSNFSYKFSDGSRKRGRPRKAAAHPETPAATREPKRRGRPPKPRSLTVPMKKKKRGRPPKSTAAPIVPRSKQIKTDFSQNFAGAAAIVLPTSFLNEKAANNSIVIFPNVIQSLIDASNYKRKRGRPQNSDIKEMIGHLGIIGKRRSGRPRKKFVIQNQTTTGVGEQQNPATPVAKGPGRPWKIRDMLVPGNVHGVSANVEEISVPGSIHGTENGADLNVKKRPVGRPRKKAIA